MSKKSLNEMAQHAEEAAEFLKKLANPNRLMVLCALSDGEQSVGELNEKVALSQSALSQHLAALREANLVNTRREGQTIYYNLQGKQAVQVIKVLQSLYCH
jgi:ArsR family transcriptional regulator, virulence genes transcriptional regulator